MLHTWLTNMDAGPSLQKTSGQIAWSYVSPPMDTYLVLLLICTTLLPFPNTRHIVDIFDLVVWINLLNESCISLNTPWGKWLTIYNDIKAIYITVVQPINRTVLTDKAVELSRLLTMTNYLTLRFMFRVGSDFHYHDNVYFNVMSMFV